MHTFILILSLKSVLAILHSVYVSQSNIININTKTRYWSISPSHWLNAPLDIEKVMHIAHYLSAGCLPVPYILSNSFSMRLTSLLVISLPPHEMWHVVGISSTELVNFTCSRSSSSACKALTAVKWYSWVLVAPLGIGKRLTNMIGPESTALVIMCTVTA